MYLPSLVHSCPAGQQLLDNAYMAILAGHEQRCITFLRRHQVKHSSGRQEYPYAARHACARVAPLQNQGQYVAGRVDIAAAGIT